jgi:hypothetical protein
MVGMGSGQVMSWCPLSVHLAMDAPHHRIKQSMFKNATLTRKSSVEHPKRRADFHIFSFVRCPRQCDPLALE